MKKSNSIIVSLMVILSVVFAAGIALAQAISSQPVYYVNFMDTISKVEELSTFVEAIKAAGLEETLNKGEYTIFAPTNDAFAALPEGKLERLLQPENKEALKDILTYHVISRRLSVEDFRAGEKYKTLNGHLIHVFFEKPPIVVNQKINVLGSYAASNAIIYTVDKVILPPEGPKPK
jgi:uncharacterized surface protein with fasciclin (FAS1) repeats